MRIQSLSSTLCLVTLTACSGAGGAPVTGSNVSAAAPLSSATNRETSASVRANSSATAGSITAPSGYTVSTFASAANGDAKPDAIFVQGRYVYVAYQNASTATGGGDSSLVQYDSSGVVVHSVKVPGRCDGMRYNPYTNIVWLTVNEDANSALYTWKPSTGALTKYAFSAAAHGGGYDDLAFADGKAFIVASNPTLNGDGVNASPAIVRVVLAGNIAKVTPVLQGNANAQDVNHGGTIALNLTDPDSLTVDPRGNLVLIAQADRAIVTLKNPGEDDQRVSRLSVTTALDDTVWATDRDGTFYVADSAANTVYRIRGPITRGAIYTEVPADSAAAAGTVGTVDPATGTVTPLFTGFKSPTGLVFISDHDRDDRTDD